MPSELLDLATFTWSTGNRAEFVADFTFFRRSPMMASAFSSLLFLLIAAVAFLVLENRRNVAEITGLNQKLEDAGNYGQIVSGSSNDENAGELTAALEHEREINERYAKEVDVLRAKLRDGTNAPRRDSLRRTVKFDPQRRS